MKHKDRIKLFKTIKDTIQKKKKKEKKITNKSSISPARWRKEKKLKLNNTKNEK